MRTRTTLTSLVLGGALALGGTVVTAQAAEPAPAPKISVNESKTAMAGWHFYHAYWTQNTCRAVGQALGGPYNCEYKRGNDGKMKWFLYRWY